MPSGRAPTVRRRAHRDRPDVLDEVVVVERARLVLVLLEQPVQRVVLVGDVAVERRGGVEDRAASSGHSPAGAREPARSGRRGRPRGRPPQHLPHQLAAVRGEGQHVRDHAAEHEALRRLAQRVDDPVLPRAAAVDVADDRRASAAATALVPGDQRRPGRRPLARREVVRPRSRPARPPWSSTRCSQHRWIESSGAVPAQHGSPRGTTRCGSRRRTAAWRGRAAPRVSSRSWWTSCSVSGVHRCLRGVHPQRHGRVEVDPVGRGQPVAAVACDGLARRVPERPGERAVKPSTDS